VPLFARCSMPERPHAAALFRLGECHAALGDESQALHAFEQTVEASRGHHECRNLQDWATEHIAKLRAAA